MQRVFRWLAPAVVAACLAGCGATSGDAPQAVASGQQSSGSQSPVLAPSRAVVASSAPQASAVPATSAAVPSTPARGTPTPPAPPVTPAIADSACVIKGNISRTGERIYHVPGQRDYDKTIITESKGERWFCTEAEALAAGWRKSKV